MIVHDISYNSNVLICHNNLGTKTQSHQSLIKIRHENGVIVLQNELPLCIVNKEWVIQYNDHAKSMNDKEIIIPKEVIRIEWVSLA